MDKPSEEDRIEILRVQTKQMPIDPDVSFEEIGKQLEGYTGAQLRLLCTDAAMNAIKDTDNQEQTIKHKHFIQALSI